MADRSDRPDRRAAYLPDKAMLIFAVSPELVDAVVIGGQTGRGAAVESFRVTWTPATGWRCSCRAVTTGCGHVGAVRAVVVLAPAAAAETVEAHR